MSDKEYYAIIADELDNDKADGAIWTQAYAQSGGNPEATKATYIRLRLADLKKRDAAPTAFSLQLAMMPDQLSLADVPPPPPPINKALEELRTRLRTELAARGKPSLYDTLGVAPDASTEEVEAAIARLDQKEAAGEFHATPEYRLARETLQDPWSREAYDEKLMESIAPSSGAVAAPRSYAPRAVERQSASAYAPSSVIVDAWDSTKANIIVAVLCLVTVGYLMLGFQRDRTNREIEKAKVVAAQAEAEGKRMLEEQRLANERKQHDNDRAVADKIVDRNTEFSNRAIDSVDRITEARRQSLDNMVEKSAALQREAMEHREEELRLRRAEMEQRAADRTAEREKRYWACMNSELDSTDSATASSRCASYR